MTAAPLPPLPPLPPLLGADESDAHPGGPSMLDVLTEEHHQLADLYQELAAAGADRDIDAARVDAARVDAARSDDARLAALTSVLAAALTRHLSAEEQYLYPTVRAVLPDGERLARIEIDADKAISHALRRLAAGPPTDLRGLAEVEPALRLHIRRAEESLFPQLRAALDVNDLIRLGNRVQIAEEAAPTRPHPGTPFTPPWNKLVEPAVGVVDKVRDVATRRTTRVEDL